MAKEYTFKIDDDTIASDFEAGLSEAGFTPDSLWKKEVSDFVNAHRRESAEKSKPAVTSVEAEEVTTAEAVVK